MRVLHLTLKKKWFDMIASGEKKEEYLELKPYWAIRLMTFWNERGWDSVYKDFDLVRFKHGYAATARTIDVEIKGIVRDTGNPLWGAFPDKRYFVIKLGEIVKRNG